MTTDNLPPDINDAMLRALLIHIKYHGMQQGKYLAIQFGIDWEQFKRTHSKKLTFMELQRNDRL
jgi:hypothetical protein